MLPIDLVEGPQESARLPVPLRTPRLWLRPFEEADVESYKHLVTDPEATQWIGGTRTENEAAESILRMRDSFHQRGWGTLAVVRSDRPDGVCIGYCGVRPLLHTQDVEITFGFLKAHWNNGFATEAAGACLDAAFRMQRFPSIVATVYPNNLRSLAVLRKLQMKEDARVFGTWPNDVALLFRLTKSDWELRRSGG